MPKHITRGEIDKFVKENMIPANNSRIECGDGRYTKEQAQGAIRAFGGDFGMVMAFAGALKDEGTYIDSEEIVRRYLRAVKKVRGEDTKLYHHTDTHNHSLGEIGCGHAAKASSPEHDGLYGSLTHSDVKDLYNSFSKDPNSNLTVLEGEHQEKAVLFVHGVSDDTDIHYSINSMDTKGNMYFVVDMDRINKFIEQVVPLFSDGLLVPVEEKDVKENFLKQMQATADLLASDLDKFKITIDNTGNFSMNQLPQVKP
jgi:hypothetical protein